MTSFVDYVKFLPWRIISALRSIFHINNFYICYLPFKITKPGMYFLRKSLSSRSRKSIIIQCSGVKIDGRGFQLTYSGNPKKQSTCIYSMSKSSINIHNIIITNYTYGMYYDSPRENGRYLIHLLPTNIKISNCCLMRCKFRGIRLQGAQSEISNCIIWKTGGSNVKGLFFSMGIEVFGANNNIILNAIIDTFSSKPQKIHTKTESYSEGVALSLSEGCRQSCIRNNFLANNKRSCDLSDLNSSIETTSQLSWQRTIGMWVSHTSVETIIKNNYIYNFNWGIAICEAKKSPPPVDCTINDCDKPLVLGNNS